MPGFKILNVLNGNKWTKTCIIFGGFALGVSMYSFYKYLQKENGNIDEGFEDISMVDDFEKKILVLGLDGAGKSSFLSHLYMLENPTHKLGKEECFRLVTVKAGKECTLNFLEIGVCRNVRMFWSSIVEDVDVVLYIVDSTNEENIAASSHELKKIISCQSMNQVPILILANKQDLAKTSNSNMIFKSFGVPEFAVRNPIHILPLKVPPIHSVDSLKSVQAVKDVVIRLCKPN